MTWRPSGAHEASPALRGPQECQACPVSQAVLERTAPSLQDLQAFLVCLDGMDPAAFLASQGPQVLQDGRDNQERLARKAASVKQAPQDPRAAREIQALLVLLGRTAWQDPRDRLDHRDPLDPLDHQDQDSLLDLMTWKAPGDLFWQQPEEWKGHRDCLAYQD